LGPEPRDSAAPSPLDRQPCEVEHLGARGSAHTHVGHREQSDPIEGRSQPFGEHRSAPAGKEVFAAFTSRSMTRPHPPRSRTPQGLVGKASSWPPRADHLGHAQVPHHHLAPRGLAMPAPGCGRPPGDAPRAPSPTLASSGLRCFSAFQGRCRSIPDSHLCSASERSRHLAGSSSRRTGPRRWPRR
jgi:hypothetical protein